MNEILAALSRLIGQVIFWATVQPWEQCLRVRAGKHVRRLQPGLHFRIPIFDVILKQSTRVRATVIPTQTISTLDDHTLILSGSLMYEIENIELLYRGMHHAEDTLIQMATALLAASISNSNRAELTPSRINEQTTAELCDMLQAVGIKGRFQVNDFAYVRTYRLIQDQRWSTYGKPLHTDEQSA